jgi:putative restriction endonuclease
MLSPHDILTAFATIRRARREDTYAPHKPLLLLLALGRIQHGLPRLATFAELEPQLKEMLRTFAPASSLNSRHYPFWHLRGDAARALWELNAPKALTVRPDGATPNLGELRQPGVQAGFSAEVFDALVHQPSLLQQAAQSLLNSSFPETLHADILAAAGLDLSPSGVPVAIEEATYTATSRKRRDPAFREKVMRAYEWRCCVCGFDLRIGHLPAGLEAAHIQWHHVGGPDIEPNGLSLCALHHKLFDLGVFTIEPAEHRIVFSQHALAAERGNGGELRHHGQPMLPPQDADLKPQPVFLAWNRDNVFKSPARRWGLG